MAPISGSNVDIVPFAARQVWSSAQEFEIWWEDPRDIFRVVVQLDPDSAGAPGLAYWRSAWPRVRVPKGALVGAGESGWLANDDWTNGVWQTADCAVSQDQGGWTFTFQPLNAREFPQEAGFPAVFRRTLKLKFSFPQADARITRIAAYTDSVWREEQIAIQWRGQKTAWDGRLEAFNGEILTLRAANDLTSVSENGSLSTQASAAAVSGVTASVYCAWNEDHNSFDRTIVTLRSDGLAKDLPGVSFYLDEALGSEPIFIPDLGLLVHRAEKKIDFTAYAEQWQAQRVPTLSDQIQALPEQTWERSWANMARKTSRMYYTLGCEGSRQKFAVEPQGSVFMTDTYIRRVAGKDSDRLGWDEGRLNLRFGFPPLEPADRSILAGDLPIIRTEWVDAGLVTCQEVFAAWLWAEDPTERRPGDDPVIAMMQVRFTNLGQSEREISFPIQSWVNAEPVEALVCQDGWIATRGGKLRLLVDANGNGSLTAGQPDAIFYRLRLAPGAAHTITLKIPHLQLDSAAEKAHLAGMDYTALRERAAGAWRKRIDRSTQIRTPNETINRFYRTHLMHMLVINDREPGAERNVARCGGFYYGSYPDEGCMGIVDLDRRGLHQEAERCLELYVQYQGTVPLPGNFKSAEGVFYGSGGYEVAGYNRNQGWVLWCLAEHYRFTRDRAWLERIAPALVKGCDWIIRERQATLLPGTIQYGFLPSGSLEDVTDYWTWLATSAYAAWGFHAAAAVLAEINHPETARLTRESQAFSRDLRAGFFAACARSPVVRLRDGSWVPHFPARQERRGRDFGWLREVLEGACHLIYCGLVDAREPAASWILKDYEDNLFLSEQYGYQTEDFERQWFDWGGFSMQSNLLLFPPLYLWRDEPKHYLRGYFNGFTSAFFPDTVTMCEHALPDLSHWRGDHFKSSDEANSNGWLRGMFVAEHGQELWIGQAVPRAWFEHGKTMAVERAATHFGETSVQFTSLAGTGLITASLDLPRRNPPARIVLRVRHPEGKPIQSVWVDGLPHTQIDPQKEIIILEGKEGQVNVRVHY